MDAKIRQLLRDFKTAQDPVIAMQIASALCRTEDTTTELLAIGACEDQGSGMILISASVDISSDQAIANNHFHAQMACNQLYEHGGLTPDQILVVGYGATAPEVMFHWEYGRHYHRPGIEAVQFVLHSLKVTTQANLVEGPHGPEYVIDTNLRAGTKKTNTVVPIFEKVFSGSTIVTDNHRIIIYTGITPLENEDEDEDD